MMVITMAKKIEGMIYFFQYWHKEQERVKLLLLDDSKTSED